MKKILFVALGLTMFTSMASAVVQCNPSPPAVQTFTLQALFNLGSSGCEIGDKIFANFDGNFKTGADATDNFTFTAVDSLDYLLNFNAGNPPSHLANTLTFTYTVSVDQSQVLTGNTASIIRVSGNIGDGGNGTSSSTLVKQITDNGSPSPCTVTIAETAGGQLPVPCNFSPGATFMTISETYSYTGGATNTVTGFDNSFGQALTLTTGAPEPFSMLLFGSGLLAVSIIGRKRLMSRK